MLWNSGTNVNKHHLANSALPSGISSTGPSFFLEDVSVNFGSIQALKSIQLSIAHGEIVFITGASGSGKTTLLKVLSGELVPDTGSVSLPRTSFVSKVFQDVRLIGKHSLETNLRLCYDPSIYSSKNEFNQDLIELTRVLGVYDRLHIPASCANGGLRQKIAIIRALLARPDVFIADEPTSSLDLENAKRLFDLLNVYNIKRGLSVIWASHNSELVKKFSGRIVHLDGGRLVYSGHACFI